MCIYFSDPVIAEPVYEAFGVEKSEHLIMRKRNQSHPSGLGDCQSLTDLAEKGDNKAKFSSLRQQRITELELLHFRANKHDNIQCKYPYDDIRRILHTDSRIR